MRAAALPLLLLGSGGWPQAACPAAAAAPAAAPAPRGGACPRRSAGHALLQVHQWVSPGNEPGSAVNETYLVGNGPASEADHALLAAASPWQVFRFNGMVNARPSEPVGRVFVRDMAIGYWGLDCCPSHSEAGANESGLQCPQRFRSNVCRRLREAVEVIFLGGDAEKTRRHRRACARTLPRSRLTFERGDRPVRDGDVNLTLDARWLNGWSSGFLGLMHLRTLLPDATIHVMGMNWNAHKAGPHPFQLEERFFRSAPNIVIHASPSDTYHRRETCAVVEG